MAKSKKHKCPSCGKPMRIKDNLYLPFCSERCKMVDLEAWLGDKYSVPSEPGNGSRVVEGEEDGEE